MVFHTRCCSTTPAVSVVAFAAVFVVAVAVDIVVAVVAVGHVVVAVGHVVVAVVIVSVVVALGHVVVAEAVVAAVPVVFVETVVAVVVWKFFLNNFVFFPPCVLQFYLAEGGASCSTLIENVMLVEPLFCFPEI